MFGADGAAGLVDLEDQFRRITAMADGEREYLQGVIEFYRTGPARRWPWRPNGSR